jgi:hemerythrin-like metal-binding protein
MVCRIPDYWSENVQMNNTFKSIEWTEEMATGIPAIDNQHRFLVETLQDANEKLLNDRDGYLLDKIAKDLLGYAITHFETEEKLMQRYGYDKSFPDDAKSHIHEHREFSKKVVDICDQLREGNRVSRIEVLTFLNNWLYNHILDIDQKYGNFLRNAMNE